MQKPEHSKCIGTFTFSTLRAIFSGFYVIRKRRTLLGFALGILCGKTLN
jgi:hypothetical protein